MKYSLVLGLLIALSSPAWPATALAQDCGDCAGFEGCEGCGQLQAGAAVGAGAAYYRALVRRPSIGLGVRGHAGGVFYIDTDNAADTDDVDFAFYGVGGVFRIIAHPNFGLEITGDYSWTDVDNQWQVPVQLSGLFIFNSYGYVEPIVILGVDYTASKPWFLDDEVLSYMGAHVGVGVEFMMGSHLGLMVDVRYAIQGLLNDEDDFPNFDLDPLGIDQRVVGNVGINFYL